MKAAMGIIVFFIIGCSTPNPKFEGCMKYCAESCKDLSTTKVDHSLDYLDTTSIEE